MFRIETTFNSERFIHSFGARVRNMHENMTFVIGMLNYVSYQFVLVLSILRPKKPFGLICLFDLIVYVPLTIFQLYRDGSSWVEPALN